MAAYSLDNLAYIEKLPDEIIAIILSVDDLLCSDVLSFGRTSKKFLKLIRNENCVWKRKLKAILTEDIFKYAYGSFHGDWYSETENYFVLKHSVYNNIAKMSSKYFSRETELKVEDVQDYFKLALASNVNYFLTFSILCNLIKKANKTRYILNCIVVPPQKPYTLTDAYYVKIVARYLMHVFLMIEWTQKCNLNQLSPEKIVHFFVQWTDTENIYHYVELDAMLESLVGQVESLLNKGHPLLDISREERQKWANGMLVNNVWNSNDCLSVLSAVTEVIYNQKSMALTMEANLELLDMLQIVKTKCGNVIVVAALYEAIARRCGVRCDLITFPNHFYLEWRENYDPSVMAKSFTVNLIYGKLIQKRQCPFSQGNDTMQSVQYFPRAVLQRLLKSYRESLRDIRNVCTQNLFNLSAFMSTESYDNNLYKDANIFLNQQISRYNLEMNTPIRLNNVSDYFRQVIRTISNLKTQHQPFLRKVVPKKRSNRLKFAVGMICQHLKYEYVCVIRGWDSTCTAAPEWQRQMGVATLTFGPKQPFYSVIAVDYSERYVAQENLVKLSQPSRLYHLEDVITKEFSYFDGFSYAPNDEKEAEYPEDSPVRVMYQLQPTQSFFDECP